MNSAHGSRRDAAFPLPSALGKKERIEGVDVGGGELLERHRAQGWDDVTLDMALVGEVRGGPDGGANSREPFPGEELTHQHFGGLDIGTGGDRGEDLGERFLSFPFRGEPSFHLLPTFDCLLQVAVAQRTVPQMLALDPEPFVAGRATLQGLRAKFGYVLPGGPFL